MNLSQLGEFGLIRRLARTSRPSAGVALGIGDDAAAVSPRGKDKLLLLTCDPVIESVHFDSHATPFQIGWKAMARNLSDIAAMGGTPLHALDAASLPRKTSVAKAIGIHKGLTAAAQRHGVSIVGGDTSHNAHGIHLTVTVIGEVARRNMITRAGARVGDLVCVTGSLGGSILGKHLKFEPRLREARFLAQRFYPTSMMDLSDGLASDLQRLAEQSRVGFEIHANSLPISPALRSQQLKPRKEIRHAMRDGEDYELLFTLPSRKFTGLQREWRRHFKLRLTCVGVVRPKSFGIQLVDDHTRSRPRATNDHFRA